jgi:C1q domain
MTWPINAVNGQTTAINGVTYVYNGAKNAWSPISIINNSVNIVTGNVATYTGNVTVANLISVGGGTFGSDITIAGNLISAGNLSSGNLRVTGALNSSSLTINENGSGNQYALTMKGSGSGDQWAFTIGSSTGQNNITSLNNVGSAYAPFSFNGSTFTIGTTGVGATTSLFVASSGNVVVTQTTPSASTTTGALVVGGGVGIGGNITMGGNLSSSGSGYFFGPYNENSTLSGVFIGNTGSGTPSPRIGFYNGTTSQNWQIDNYGGTFRWFTPGVARMQLDANGNLSLPSGTANVTYTPATTTGSVLNLFGANTQGGTGYADFLRVTNSSGGVTNPNKFFRVNTTGGLEIVNSSYGSTIFTLTDGGDVNITGNLAMNGIAPGYASNRPAFRVVGLNSTGYTTSSPTGGVLTGSQFAVDYNQGSYLNTTTGVFTAPVAGLYQVCFTARTNSNTNANASGIAVQKTGGTNIAYVEWAANTTANHIGASTIIKLAVGDTLKLVVTSGTVNFDGNNNWSVAYLG